MFLLITGASWSRGQITNVTLDLRNNFSFQKTQQEHGDLSMQNHGQYYVLGLTGYALDERFLVFNVQTSLTKYSSTSKSRFVDQTLDNRNQGYYNFSMTLFPNNSIPLTIYGSRYDQVNTASSTLVVPSFISTDTHNKVETLGLRWHIAKSSVLPQTELTLERSRTKGVTFGYPTDQKNELVGLHLSNNSADGASGYSFRYTGNRIYGELLGGERNTHEFQLYGNSRISGETDFYANGIYAFRDRATSRTLEFGGTYIQTERVRHQLKLTNSENRYPGVELSTSVSNGVSHETNVVLSDRTQVMFGTHYLQYYTTIGDAKRKNDRAQVQAQLTYSELTSIADLNMNAATGVGAESYFIEGRKFVQQSQLGLSGVSKTFNRIQIGLYNTFSYNTTYFFGNLIQNLARVTVSTDIVPRSVVEGEFSRGDTKYFEDRGLPYSSTTAVGGKITTRLNSIATVDVQQLESWTRSWFVEHSTRTAGGIIIVGVLKGLMIQVRGERVYSDFTRLTMGRVEASADYQFYAFSLSGKYLLYRYGGIQTQGVMFEIRRPFSIDLR